MVEATINSKAINTLLDSIPECILFTDLEGNITSFNTKAKEKFFTISNKSLTVGKSIFDYVAESTNAQFNDNFKKVKKSGEIVEDKYHLKTSTGKLVIFQFSLAPVYNQSVINQLCVTGHQVSQLMENDQRNIEQSVLENERKYRSLTENSIDAILLTKPTGEILSANAAACNMFGLSEKEICERGRGKLIDITDPNLEKLLIERSRTGSARGELTLIRNDGTSFPGEVSSAIFTDVDGNQKTSMVIRDVSERKNAEVLLRESEERYRILFEQNLYGLYRSTPTGKIVECNEAFAKMLKYDSAEELMNTNAFELYFSSDDRTQFVHDILKNQIKYNYEGILKRKDGTPLFYIENVSLQKDAKTGETFFDGIVIDITKRKLAELRSKEINERYNYAGKATTDVIWDWDIKSKELFLGDRFQELFGYALHHYKWTFSIWADLIHPDDKERVITSRLNKIIYNDEVNWQDEYRFIRADGSVAYILDRGILLRNNSGTYRMIGSMQDITKRKKEEFALQQSEARLQGIIASQTNYILRTDLNGMYTYYNPKFNDDFAWIHNCENLIGMYSMYSIMAYDHQKVQDIVAKCIATPNIVYQVEIDKPAKNNGVKTTVWDFICLTDADNRPTEIQCVGIDISERKKAERAHIKSLEEKNRILESIRDGFFAVDKNWKITYWNHQAEKSLKKLKSESIGQHLWTLFPNADTSESYKKYHQAFETNRVVHFEDYHPHLKRWYDVSAYPLDNTLSVFFKDITQRKKIEQQIRDSEEVRNLVIDAAMDAIICMDTSG
ncbi:MAG: PAS domain S-box protein, partial [Chitinophagaceae bacterium]